MQKKGRWRKKRRREVREEGPVYFHEKRIFTPPVGRKENRVAKSPKTD